MTKFKQIDISKVKTISLKNRKSKASVKSFGQVYNISKGKSNHNAQRSNSKNHYNPAYKASRDNRSNQINPNNPTYDSSRESEKEDKEEE